MPCSLKSLANTKIRGSKWFKAFQKVQISENSQTFSRHVKALHVSERPAASWLILSGHFAACQGVEAETIHS